MNPSRLKLLALAALFIAPFAGAVLLYYVFPGYIPEGRQNYGAMIDPVRAAPDLALTDLAGAPARNALLGKWSLVYLGGTTCGEACAARIMVTRQVRLALAKNRERVQRVYLAPDAAAAEAVKARFGAEHHDLIVLVTGGTAAARFFAPADADAIYLLDPIGNWTMLYAGAVDHQGLYRDIKKLLRVSRAG
ncbi:MAG: SCO family protein [Gammaproteobacteria bacterium]